MTPSAPIDQYSIVVVNLPAIGPETYSLESAAAFAGIHPEMLRYYCRLGVLGEAKAQPDADFSFDDGELLELRRFEHFRLRHGIDRNTLRVIFGQRREIERLKAEIRSLRGV